MSGEPEITKDQSETSHFTNSPSTTRSHTFRKFYRGFTRAFKREKTPTRKFEFDPELLCNRKKEWMELRSDQERGLDWPQHCFEHFLIVGLPHTIDLEEVSQNITKSLKKHSGSDLNEAPNHTPPTPKYTPELLYQFPEDKPLHMKSEELVSFCFPHGVVPQMLRRSTSMSSMNDVIYGQQHLVHSDQSFVFMHKGSGEELPMFGICCLVRQMIQTPPGLVKNRGRNLERSASKHLIAAPRCYCLLSKYPFFKLHFQVLNLILGLERLDCISEYMNELIQFPSEVSSQSSMMLNSDSCAIPAFSAAPNEDQDQEGEESYGPQTRVCGGGPEIEFKDSPSSIGQSLTSNSGLLLPPMLSSSSSPVNGGGVGARQGRHQRTGGPGSLMMPPKYPAESDLISRASRTGLLMPSNRSLSNQSCSENLESSVNCVSCLTQSIAATEAIYHDALSDERSSATPSSSNHQYTNSGESEEVFFLSSSMPDLSCYQQDKTQAGIQVQTTGQNLCPSLRSICRYSSTKGIRSWSEDDLRTSPTNLSSTCLKLLSYYLELKVPLPGETVILIPEEEGFHSIEYTRPELASLKCPLTSSLSGDYTRIEAETAMALRSWSVAVLCKSLSLDNILTLIAGALLEKQIVFFCSNLGVLSSAVLSLLPLLQPFTWHSLILPVLPSQYLELLEAPVPFAVGIQHKTSEIAIKCKDLIRVNLYKDKIKNAPFSSVLPGAKTLHSRLAPWHKEVQESSKNCKKPCHLVTQREAEAIECFLGILRDHLTGLLGDIKRHTITDVTSGKGVSLLLEESFLSAFPTKDQNFMKAFTQTQIFSSYVDAIIGNHKI